MTTLRFQTSRALGAASVLSIAGAASAHAQATPAADTARTRTSGSTVAGMTVQDSGAHRTMRSEDTRGTSAHPRMRVQKDVTPAAAAPVPTPVPAPEPAPVPVPAPAPVVETLTTTTTAVVETPGPRYGNDFYFGVQGGANFPQNSINNAYKTGFSGGLQLGWSPMSSPIGLRLNALYNRFQGHNGASTLATDPTDANLYSAFADATVRLPFSRAIGAYVLAGPGVALFRNYDAFQRQTGIQVGNSTINMGSRNSTRFAVNGGGGLDFALGSNSLFIEGRYVRAFTQGRDVDYVPVTVGLRFHTR